MATTSLIIVLMTLSIVQYMLNKSYNERNSQYQTILIQTVENQDYSKQLQLLTRSYLNQNLGLEPQNSTYVKNRTVETQQMSLDLIQQMRLNLNNMKLFFDQNGLDFENSNKIKIYSLLPNNSVEIRDSKRYYAFSLWIVQLDQLYAFPDFKSQIGLYKGEIQPNGANIYDQIAFFVLVNSDQDLPKHLNQMIREQEDLISLEIARGIKINQVFAIISAVVILLSTLLAVYLGVTVLAFKHQIMIFFEKLDDKQISIMEKCALAFQRILVFPDDTSQIEQIKLDIIAYKQVQQDIKQRNNQALIMNSMNASNASNLGSIMQPESSMKKRRKINIKRKKVEIKVVDVENPKKKGGVIKRKKDIIFGDRRKNQFGIRKLDIEKAQFSPDKNQINKKVKEETKEGSSSSSEEEQKKFQKKKTVTEIEKNKKDMTLQQEDAFKTRDIHRLLNIRRSQITWRLFALAFVLTGLLIIYFIVQYLLFEKWTTQFGENSSNLTDMVKSIECQEALISDIRTMQSSNFTDYDIEDRYNRLSKIKMNPQVMDNLNETYLSCIRQNQKVTNWLQTYQDGLFYLNGSQTLCSQYLNSSVCEEVYSGVFQKTILQSSSIFLQDAMYSLIRFMSKLSNNLTQSQLKQDFIGSKQFIELLDSHTFYQQRGLRLMYQKVVQNVYTTQQTSSASMTLFIAFLCILLLFGVGVQWYVFIRVRKWFWDSFFLLQLLPRDDMDKEFIKNINEFLKQS